MQRINEPQLVRLAQDFKPCLLMVMHNRTKILGHLLPGVCDCHQDHPLVRLVGHSLDVTPPFKRIDQASHRRPTDDELVGKAQYDSFGATAESGLRIVPVRLCQRPCFSTCAAF